MRVRIEHHSRRKAGIRKGFVVAGLIFLMAGIGLILFSIQESHTEENTLNKWDSISSSTLNPQDPGPRWALEMQEGSFFELNVSASDTTRVRIGTPIYDEDAGEEVLTTLLFDRVGTRFTQKVSIDANGTYQVGIESEAATPVSVWGNVLAKKTVTTYRTVYPYPSLGTPLVLAGSTSLIYGGFTKPKRKHYHTGR